MKIKMLLILFLLSPIVYAQNISHSVSNNLRAGTGKENWGEGGFVGTQNKKYFDYYTDAKIFYGSFNAGLRYEYVNPPEYGIKRNKLARRFVEYSSDGITARLGNSFSLFSRGLSLNLFENRSLTFDTNLDGIKVGYISQNFKTAGIYGKINFVEPSTVLLDKPREESYLIKAASLEYKPFSKFSLGGSIVASENEFPDLLDLKTKDNSKIFLPELFIRYQTSALDLFINYAYKTTTYVNKNYYGSGLYASFSYSDENYGFTFEYKDYRFDLVDPVESADQFRATRMLPFQNPPTVHKEHSFTLLTRYPRTANFNDEVGFQFDLFYSFDERTSLNLNLSSSSRHYTYALDKSRFLFLKKENNASWIPSLSNEYSPFTEAYLELEHYLKQQESLVRVAFNYRNEITFDPFLETNSVQPLKQISMPVFFQYLFNENFNIKAVNESQWVLKYPKTNYFYNQLISIQVGLFKDFNVGGRIEFTTNRDEPNGEKSWLVLEGGFRLSTNHIFTLSYGSERGGQICSNGLCRQVLPFKGFRLSFINNI